MTNIQEKYLKLQRIANYKSNFDYRVDEYKSLMCCIRESSHVLTPNFLEAENLIEDWIIGFITMLWDFTKIPFTITPLDNNLLLNEDVILFYNDVKTHMDIFLKAQESNFKVAFSQLIKSWMEYGVGVIVVEELSDYYYCTTYSPENVQYKYDGNRLTEVIINYKNHENEFKTDSYISFELLHKSETEVKWSMELYDGSVSSPKIKKVLNYTPVYITRFNPPIDSSVGYGKGLQIFPLLKKISNMLQMMDEAASLKMMPQALINEDIINKNTVGDHATNGGYNAVFGGKVIRVNNVPELALAFHPVDWHIDTRDAYAQLELYFNMIRAILSKNKMLTEKGRARMTATEVQTLSSIDKEEITHLSATIVDEFLLPFLLDRAKFSMGKLNKDLAGDYESLGDIEITLSNLLTEQDALERTTEISRGLEMLNNIENFSKASGGKYNTTELIGEISKIWKLDTLGTQDKTSLMLFDAVTQMREASAGLTTPEQQPAQ